MQAQTYSRTAEGMAFIRAIEENGRSPAHRILADPWAIHFIPTRWLRTLASWSLTARLFSSFLHVWLPGGQEYVLVRARLSDDLTAELAKQGLPQLVLLGAGFDTTAFRLQNSLHGIPIFEVDHPATQAVKAAVLVHVARPPDLTLLPVDFEKENFVERLLAAGFEPGRRSLVTWLGVSYYLTPQTVAQALRQIAELSSPESWLLFDYVTEEVLAGKVKNCAAQIGFNSAARSGEPFLSGLDPERIDSYLAGLGFKLLAHYDGRQLRDRYCGPGRAPVDFTRIALCQRTGAPPIEWTGR
jgi:methyltransferase (TIGR00027 family)